MNRETELLERIQTLEARLRAANETINLIETRVSRAERKWTEIPPEDIRDILDMSID